MPVLDQVVWQSVNVVHDGQPKFFKRGDLLPEAAGEQEAAARNLLRIGGAIQIVEVVYTPEELAVQATQIAAAAARRETAPPAPPDSAPAGPGLPTLTSPGAAPVVIGDEELRAEHEHEQVKGRRGAGGKFAKTEADAPAGT